MRSYKILPDIFSLDDILPRISTDKAASIKKLYDLWKAGVPVYLYGSFVTQCGMLLTDKKPTCAKDVDAASTPIQEEQLPELCSTLDSHGFKKKNLEKTPYHFIPTFYSFEYSDGNTKIDFMLKLPNYTETPNSLLFSSFTLHFIDKEPSKICFEFDNRKTQLEYYCNNSINEVTPPQLEERGVIRRILKHINNNRVLYQEKALNFYYGHEKVENFIVNDHAWKKLTDHIKDILKKTIGRKKFFSYYNELRRTIKEGTFFIPEAQLFIENFCSVILAHTDIKNKKYLAIQTQNMVKILQNFFFKYPEKSEDFYLIVNRLLQYSPYLINKDPRIIEAITKQLNSPYQSGYKKGSHIPVLFVPKIINNRPSESTIIPNMKI